MGDREILDRITRIEDRLEIGQLPIRSRSHWIHATSSHG
jgi:hypothetical protein